MPLSTVLPCHFIGALNSSGCENNPEASLCAGQSPCATRTVSMAALMIGYQRMLREIWVCVFVLTGTTPECAGRSNYVIECEASGTGKMDHKILE